MVQAMEELFFLLLSFTLSVSFCWPGTTKAHISVPGGFFLQNRKPYEEIRQGTQPAPGTLENLWFIGLFPFTSWTFYRILQEAVYKYPTSLSLLGNNFLSAFSCRMKLQPFTGLIICRLQEKKEVKSCSWKKPTKMVQEFHGISKEAES